MSKIIIYGAGLLVIVLVAGLLLYLTLDNASSGQAIYGTRNGSYYVSGPASILINVGIVGLIGALGTYISYLFLRKPVLLNSYKLISVVSGVLIIIGLVWGLA